MVESYILAVHFVLIVELYGMHYFKYPEMIILQTLANFFINKAANVFLLFYFFHERIIPLLAC
jgi:hypothetical protein